jgi:tungstate transport system substrate-binding protein
MQKKLKRVFCLLVFFVTVIAAQGIYVVDCAVADSLLLATTTSTDNTGLLEYLMPEFIADTGIDIRWIATGTGKALKLGENCDVDVLLVHAPLEEQAFVDNGFGTVRTPIMYNDFILIGPVADPAKIKGRKANDAFRQIWNSKAAFVSRGDNSGTHKKERALWILAEVSLQQNENWYRESGQGMLATINIANELKSYTLTDRGTYIKYDSIAKDSPELEILVEGDPAFLNHYSIIPVNPARCKNVKSGEARAFTAWMSGGRAQDLIGRFRLSGRQLFVPNGAGK